MSTEKIILSIVLVVVSVGMTVLLVYMVRTRKRIEAAWQAFAQRIGTLEVTHRENHYGDPWPELTGTYHGVAVSARLVTRGTGEGRSLHTVVRASCRRQLPNDFGLAPQGMFFALQKAYGAQDIELGDSRFDREFVIEAADESAAKALLADPTLREQLLAQAARAPRLSVSDGAVFAEDSGEVTKPDKLALMFDATVRCALALESATASPAMQHHARTAGATQSWWLPRDAMRVFGAVMTFPLGFALAILLSAVIPGPFGGLGWLAAVVLVAIAFKLLLPPRPRLSLDAQQLLLEQGKERTSIPLRGCQWWCGPWHKKGYVCGSILYLQGGGQQLSIGGLQHSFDDPGWYQAAAGDDPAVAMMQGPFADLLNGLGYAMRSLRA